MKRTGFAAAHVGMLLWALLIAVSFSAAAQVSQAIDPILLTGLRLLCCALVFLPLLLFKGDTAMTARGLLGHAVLGLLLALYFGSLFEALRYTSAVNTGTMFTLVPLLTLLFEAILTPDSSLKRRVLPMVDTGSRRRARRRGRARADDTVRIVCGAVVRIAACGHGRVCGSRGGGR